MDGLVIDLSDFESAEDVPNPKIGRCYECERDGVAVYVIEEDRGKVFAEHRRGLCDDCRKHVLRLLVAFVEGLQVH